MSLQWASRKVLLRNWCLRSIYFLSLAGSSYWPDLLERSCQGATMGQTQTPVNPRIHKRENKSTASKDMRDAVELFCEMSGLNDWVELQLLGQSRRRRGLAIAKLMLVVVRSLQIDHQFGKAFSPDLRKDTALVMLHRLARFSKSILVELSTSSTGSLNAESL